MLFMNTNVDSLRVAKLVKQESNLKFEFLNTGVVPSERTRY